MQGFQRTCGFPKTIGAIDGTHIKIDAPEENAADYVNRKGFHSIQLQVFNNFQRFSIVMKLIFSLLAGM